MTKKQMTLEKEEKGWQPVSELAGAADFARPAAAAEAALAAKLRRAQRRQSRS
jgi:hypothetical protein